MAPAIFQQRNSLLSREVERVNGGGGRSWQCVEVTVTKPHKLTLTVGSEVTSEVAQADRQDEPNVLLTLLPSVSTVGCPDPRHKLDISGNPTSGSSTLKSSMSVGCR